MVIKFLCALSFVLSAGIAASSQDHAAEPTPTPVAVVITDTMPKIKPPAPRPTPSPIIVGSSNAENGPSVSAEERTSTEVPAAVGAAGSTSASANTVMAFAQIKSKIALAKREMQSRPIATALTEGVVPTDYVRVAFEDRRTGKVDYFVMAKESFLSTLGEKATTSQSGMPIRVRTIRGNGVNTPLVIFDSMGRQLQPLLVQYPVVREGRYMETAYYISTHPGLITPEVVNAGRYYVRNVVEIARDRLRQKGITIQPKIADIAERLATVEHVDHQRFRTEHHPNIYNDIFTLFALNEGQTYRYSVSSAGAGGMVQMIPSTYRMVRSWHPNVGLMPDFVEGMRNHVNATQAMLLYMQRTWSDLLSSPTVGDALVSGIATQEQLMAAGYNSNPARLAGYINRGGSNWTNLIPRETQIYLRIYESLEKHVPMTPRTR